MGKPRSVCRWVEQAGSERRSRRANHVLFFICYWGGGGGRKLLNMGGRLPRATRGAALRQASSIFGWTSVATTWLLQEIRGYHVFSARKEPSRMHHRYAQERRAVSMACTYEVVVLLLFLFRSSCSTGVLPGSAMMWNAAGEVVTTIVPSLIHLILPFSLLAKCHTGWPGMMPLRPLPLRIDRRLTLAECICLISLSSKRPYTNTPTPPSALTLYHI